jgi:hypothetical protein
VKLGLLYYEFLKEILSEKSSHNFKRNDVKCISKVVRNAFSLWEGTDMQVRESK